MSVCKSCQADIVWCKTVNGKSMPLDAEPSPDGNMRLVRDELGVVGLLAEVVPEGERAMVPVLFRSHFATCAQAKEHRRG